ncbi:putative acireductone synthase UTR4 [Saccharomyces paradoxus]|uniref:Enolase-phosphatase E1 n=1 Tax=Saccharomyces paradoxus TaxID=27291 RepID=A0A8B8UPU8_SACPA|nr:Utr4 [Saccharomyces paradoxus]QHS72746.1 Utr4 [Saccharomyces paradoxus]
MGDSYSTYLLDIEGTVCPISFVKDTLFPYFAKKVPQLVQQDSRDSPVSDILSQFHIGDKDQLQAHILELVAKDVKDPILKQLQGHIWAQGYESGQIKAPIYADAIDFIKRKKRVFIYSSGSVKAQKLLFGYVQDPNTPALDSLDLNSYIDGYFDINTSGKKTKAQSYANILRDIGASASEVLFLSDNPLELDAAASVGIGTGLATRPGNTPVPDTQKYQVFKNFETL